MRVGPCSKGNNQTSFCVQESGARNAPLTPS